jgi:hypothetical protein
MILMNDQFAANVKLAEFVDWKQRKGYSVRLVTTSQINTNGAPQAADITSHMRGLPDTDYPQYLLVIGNSSVSNGVAGVFIQQSAYFRGGYSDFDYALRDTADNFPDLCYGRLPASSNSELSVMLEKLLAADRNPPGAGAYRKVLVASTLQDSQPRDNREDTLFCETADAVASYFEQDPNGVDYSCRRAFTNPNNVNYRCYWNANSLLWNPTNQITTRITDTFLTGPAASQRIAETINAGVNLVLHRDHGTPSGWTHPPFSAADVNRLTNGLYRPLIMSINCLSGDYLYENCFGLSWLLHPNGGAYAVIESVDVSTSWCNDWLTHGLFSAFLPDYLSWHAQSTAPQWPKALPAPGGAYGAPGSAPRLGQALNFAKMYMLEFNTYAKAIPANVDTLRIFHLFGDPEAFILLPEPANIQVAYPKQIFAGSTNLIITTDRPGCMVGLHGPEVGVQGVGYADAFGRVAVSISPATSGNLYVTATHFGCRPFEGVIKVRVPAGDPPSIDEQPQSLIVAVGERAEFRVAAQGAPPLIYQWSLNGVPLSGAVSSNYVIQAAAQAADAGRYTVVVSNAFNSLTSAPATLVIQTNTATVYTFANRMPLAIEEDFEMDPYPTSVSVTGVMGTLTNVSVTLSTITYDYMGDLTGLLVSPDGQSVLLFSGIGGVETAESVTLTFDDHAAVPADSELPPTSGTYLPWDWLGACEIPFAAPAPPSPYHTNLSAFAQTDPNGRWSLYLSDLYADSYGIVQGGWSLSLGVNPRGRTAPAITEEPQDAIRFSGQTWTATVKVTGTAPFSYQWYKDGKTLVGKQSSTLTLSNLQIADGGTYTVTVSNLYGVVTSNPARMSVMNTLGLSDALNATNLTWTSTSVPWFGQALDSHDGVGAARSQLVGEDQDSSLQTTVIGPGIVTFWWKVSSEEGYDELVFDIGQNTMATLSGEVGWTFISIKVPEGEQDLSWTYYKDESFSMGRDAGWVDEVTYRSTLGVFDHFDWTIPGTNWHVNEAQVISLTAKDPIGNTVGSFNGPAAIQGMIYGTPTSMLGPKVADATGDGGESGYTDGFDFTPNTDLLVTAVRTCYGIGVSIWQDDGTPVVSQEVVEEEGVWRETTLDEPVILKRGTRYILGVFYMSGGTDYYLTNAPPAFPEGRIGTGWFVDDDVMPWCSWPGSWPLVDIKYQPLVPANVPVTPVTIHLTDGTWSGNISIGQPVTNLRLCIADTQGLLGGSTPITVRSQATQPLLSIRSGNPPILQIQSSVGAVLNLLTSVSIDGHWHTNAPITLAAPSLEIPLTNYSQSNLFFRLLWP